MATKKEYLKYLSDENLLFIENEYIRIGANLSLGGALTHLAEIGKENLINNYDWGRQVQMSFYSGPVPHLPEAFRTIPGGITSVGIPFNRGIASATAPTFSTIIKKKTRSI